MSMTHVAWVRDFSRTHGGARLVLWALASRADDKSNEAFPSVTTLDCTGPMFSLPWPSLKSCKKLHANGVRDDLRYTR